MFKICSNLGCCDKNCIDWGLLLLRLAAGIIFLVAGYGKLFGQPGIEGFTGMLSGLGIPAATFFAYLVGTVELLGGLSLILGVGTRFFAPLLAIVMVVAFITAKGGSFASGRLDISLFAITAALAMSGPGKLSVFGKKQDGSCCKGSGSKCVCKDGKCECTDSHEKTEKPTEGIE